MQRLGEVAAKRQFRAGRDLPSRRSHLSTAVASMKRSSAKFVKTPRILSATTFSSSAVRAKVRSPPRLSTALATTSDGSTHFR